MTNKIFKDIVENYQNGNFCEALKLCNETSEDKNLHTIYNIKGAIHVKQNEFIKAKSSFLKSIEINKNFLDPYKNLYLIYIKTNDFKNAIKCSKKVIEIETEKNPISFFNPPVSNLLALSLSFTRKYKVISLCKVLSCIFSFNKFSSKWIASYILFFKSINSASFNLNSIYLSSIRFAI